MEIVELEIGEVHSESTADVGESRRKRRSCSKQGKWKVENKEAQGERASMGNGSSSASRESECGQ